MKQKKLTPEIIEQVETTVMMLLLAERDCYQTWVRSGKLKEMPPYFFAGSMGGGYAAEAYGVMRSLSLLGYCYCGANNTPHSRINYSWWFDCMKEQALEEEKKMGVDKAFHLWQHAVQLLEDKKFDKLMRIKAEEDESKV